MHPLTVLLALGGEPAGGLQRGLAAAVLVGVTELQEPAHHRVRNAEGRRGGLGFTLPEQCLLALQGTAQTVQFQFPLLAPPM